MIEIDKSKIASERDQNIPPKRSKVARLLRSTSTSAVILWFLISPSDHIASLPKENQQTPDQTTATLQTYLKQENQVIAPDHKDQPPSPLPEENNKLNPESEQEEEKTPLVARRLIIPKLDLDREVQLASYNENLKTWEAPNSGLATPIPGSGNFSHPGTFWIFGHSRYGGKPQDFANLDELEEGDEIYVEAGENQNSPQEKRQYRVKKLVLTDQFYYPMGETVVLQGSAKPSEKPEINQYSSWIYEKEELIRKAQVIIRGKFDNTNLDNPEVYLNLLVIAERVKE